MLNTVKRPDRDLARYGGRGAASKARKAHSFNNTHKIDFKQVNEAALNAMPTLLARWLPGGQAHRQGIRRAQPNPSGPARWFIQGGDRRPRTAA